MAKNYAGEFDTFPPFICTTAMQLVGEIRRLYKRSMSFERIDSPHSISSRCSFDMPCLGLINQIPERRRILVAPVSQSMSVQSNPTLTLTNSISSPARPPTPSAPPSIPAPSPRSYHASTVHAPSTPPGSTPNQTRRAAPAQDAPR